MKMRRPFLTVLILLCTVSSVQLGALSLAGTEWEGGIRWIGVSQEDLTVPQSGHLTNELIVRFPLTLTNRLEWVPSLSLTMLNYRIDGGRVVPADIEQRELTALVPLLEMPVRWRFLRFAKHSYSLSGGLAGELPIPVWVEESSAMGQITGELYSDVRYLLPFTRLSGRWTLAGRLQMVLRVSGYYPVHRLWDGSGVPFYDHLMIGASVGFYFPLK
jgi:hypothetical protein